MSEDGWSPVDVLSTLQSRDEDRSKREPLLPVDYTVELSQGFHPGEGQYVIDPDYIEILGLDDPDQLVRHHK